METMSQNQANPNVALTAVPVRSSISQLPANDVPQITLYTLPPQVPSTLSQQQQQLIASCTVGLDYQQMPQQQQSQQLLQQQQNNLMTTSNFQLQPNMQSSLSLSMMNQMQQQQQLIALSSVGLDYQQMPQQQQSQQMLQQQQHQFQLQQQNNLMTTSNFQLQPNMQSSPSLSRMNQMMQQQQQFAGMGTLRQQAGFYGQMNFGGNRLSQQQQMNTGNLGSSDFVGQKNQLPMLSGPAAAADQLNLQSQLLTSPRQKTGSVQGSEFLPDNSSGQQSQPIGMMNPLNFSPQIRANGTLAYPEERIQGQMRQQQLSQQSSLTANQVAFEVEKLMECMKKKTGKHMSIVKQTSLLNDKKDQEENRNCNPIVCENGNCNPIICDLIPTSNLHLQPNMQRSPSLPSTNQMQQQQRQQQFAARDLLMQQQQRQQQFAERAILMQQAEIYLQMSFSENPLVQQQQIQQQQNQQQQMNNNLGRSGLVGQNNQLPMFSEADVDTAANRLSLLSQILKSRSRQRNSLEPGFQFFPNNSSRQQLQTIETVNPPSNSSRQHLQSIKTMNPLNLSPETRADGTLVYSHQIANDQIRELSLQQNSNTVNQWQQHQQHPQLHMVKMPVSSSYNNKRQKMSVSSPYNHQRQQHVDLQLATSPQAQLNTLEQQKQQIQSQLHKQQQHLQPRMSAPIPSSYHHQGQHVDLQYAASPQVQQNALEQQQKQQMQSHLHQQQELWNQQQKLSHRVTMPTFQKALSLTKSQTDATGGSSSLDVIASGTVTPGGSLSQGKVVTNQSLGKRKNQDLVSQRQQQVDLQQQETDLQQLLSATSPQVRQNSIDFNLQQQNTQQQQQQSPMVIMTAVQKTLRLTESQPDADATVPGATTIGRRSSHDETNQFLGKEMIQDLVSEVDPQVKLDSDVEDILLEFVDEFIDSVTTFAMNSAKERNSSTVEAKDILFHLEKDWNLNIPGYTSKYKETHEER